MSGHTTALRGECGHGTARPGSRGATPNDAEPGVDAPTAAGSRPRSHEDGGRRTNDAAAPDA